MPPRLEDDWSDSEDGDSVSEIETSVLLGIPDGEIYELHDLLDPAVSRIGGRPVSLPKQPLPHHGSHCKLCDYPMPLLVQLWCPFEKSAMDRALYVWGCERPECQRKAGSIRAWRGLKFNSKYAAKLAKKKTQETEKLAKKAADEAREAEARKARGVNPFSLSAAASTEVTSGLGAQLFGGEPASAYKGKKDVHDEETSSSESESDGKEDGDSLDAITKQLELTSLGSAVLPTGWTSSPFYKPVYLSTVSEYLPPPPKSKVKSEHFLDEDGGDNKAGKDWGLEGWEKSADLDGVFERFVSRISSENVQCVRYDLKGPPLPFGSRDKIYDRLFPPPPPAPFTTKPGYAAPIVQRRIYDASAIDKCGTCGNRRVFECQLMPNLINVLRAQGKTAINADEDSLAKKGSSPQNEEERKKELEIILGDGMDGTWREELVLVQWDE